MMNEPVWLNPKEVAAYLDLHHHTVKRIPASELPYWRSTQRGDRKYNQRDVIAYIERRMVR